jgi:hypothetical protein
MGYDYYEQRRREEEERHTYRNKFGAIIPQYGASLAYSSEDMDSESVKKYEFNNPINSTIQFMKKVEERNKLIMPNLSGCLGESKKKDKEDYMIPPFLR